MLNRPIEPAWFMAVGVAISWLGILMKSIPVIFTGFGVSVKRLIGFGGDFYFLTSTTSSLGDNCWLGNFSRVEFGE